MKLFIKLILVIGLSSCITSKSIDLKTINTENISEYELSKITDILDDKKLSYIGFEKYCIKGLEINVFNEGDCEYCQSVNEIYILWNENQKSYVQKFDNCGSFDTVEIFDFNPLIFLKNYSLKIQSEEIKSYQIDMQTYSQVSHSCFREYIFQDGETKYVKNFNMYDLTGESRNINFDYNNGTSLNNLDQILNEIITDLEREKRFTRNEKTCQDKS